MLPLEHFLLHCDLEFLSTSLQNIMHHLYSVVFFNIVPNSTGFLSSWVQFGSASNLKVLWRHPDIDLCNSKNNNVIKILLFHYLCSNREEKFPNACHTHQDTTNFISKATRNSRCKCFEII